MNSIIEELKRKSDFFCEKGASEEEIKHAEGVLGLSFADEYKEYLQQYGSVSCGGHELTGVSADECLDVVRVTIKNLQHNPNIKIPLYVVEETHIDGIVIWQASSGEIFQSEYKEAPQKIYDSLIKYVATFSEPPPCSLCADLD